MRAGAGLDKLQGGAHSIGGGVGGAAQKRVGVTQLYQHGAKVVAFGKGFAAVLLGHFALAQLYHFGNHFIHLFVGSGVENFHALDVEAAFCRSGLDFLHIAHQNGGKEAALDQTVGRLQNPGVGTFGKDDFPGIGL